MAINEFLQSGLHVLTGLSVQEIAGKHLGNWLQQTFACFNKSDYLVVPNNIAVTGEFEIGIGGSCRGIGAGLNFGADGLHRRSLQCALFLAFACAIGNEVKTLDVAYILALNMNGAVFFNTRH